MQGVAEQMTLSDPFNFDVLVKHVGTSSYVSIVLTRWSKNSDGDILITPEMTLPEIDANIQYLKDQLDILAQKAKIIAQ
jgi:hypothetical protein